MATATVSPRPGPSGHGMLIVPDLTGLTIDQAAAALRAAGFQLDRLEPADYVCSYRDDSLMVKPGTACGQEPQAGAERLPRLLAARVTLERDTYDHGGVGGASEWRRMPDLAGKAVADAHALLDRARLPLVDHFDLIETTEDNCAGGTICRTEPAAKARKVLGRKGRVYVGQATTPPTAPPPTAPPPPTQPAPGDTYF